ncbi:hypothetical protein HNQ94_002881 [Salirhabdus euzebyi]|uniref:Uncharacterized protein n=1 Tax=Salirhabdus euzebyi TaxID=394506 RepID=A0A841Q768_9BACI|nr:hypothetical protein [Salirhabdus euzebyi]MBB6454399.1 hypothetical protein [Salirhabdus euzebyi]
MKKLSNLSAGEIAKKLYEEQKKKNENVIKKAEAILNKDKKCLKE